MVHQKLAIASSDRETTSLLCTLNFRHFDGLDQGVSAVKLARARREIQKLLENSGEQTGITIVTGER